MVVLLVTPHNRAPFHSMAAAGKVKKGRPIREAGQGRAGRVRSRQCEVKAVVSEGTE